MASNKLEEAALNQRSSLIPLNTYNSSDASQNYTAGHANSISDGDNKGKGTGTFLDTGNGGADVDINGNPNYAGSGRVPNVATNQFNKDNTYDHPDTSGNVGQVVV
jgi:hypothetical protein